MRLFEIRGTAAQTAVNFLGRERAFTPANMLEESVPEGDQKLLRVAPYEISTVKLRAE